MSGRRTYHRGPTRARPEERFRHAPKVPEDTDDDGIAPEDEPATTDGAPEGLNLKGALPLLALGGFLIAYAIVLSWEEPALPGGHLAVWELVVAVGAVILGAGVFSLFLAESTQASETGRPTAGPSRDRPPERPGPIERVEPPILAARPVRGALVGHQPEAGPPPWWEGPPKRTERRPLTAPVVSPPRSAAAQRPSTDSRTPLIARPARSGLPRSVRLESRPPEPLPLDVAEALAEWEAIARPSRPLLAQPPAEPPGPRTDRCVDCNRAIEIDPGARGCQRCGRRLCAECARSAVQSSGQIACIDCLLRPIPP